MEESRLIYIMSRRVLYASLFLLKGCDARTWVTLADPVIYASAAFDPYRAEHIIERDPFSFLETDEETPKTTPIENTTNTAPPATAPVVSTAAPTARDEKVLDNGGCALDHYLYKIKMHDRWGDGWDRTSLKILQIPSDEKEQVDSEGHPLPVISENNETHTFSAMTYVHKTNKRNIDIKQPKIVFNGTLEIGHTDYDYVCLMPGKCYEVTVGGGTWENEVKWDISSAPVSYFEQYQREGTHTVAKGLAPAHCQFSIPDGENGDVQCPLTCDIDSDGPVEATMPPTLAPSLLSSEAPSTRIEEEAGMKSGVPSDMPSLIPTSSQAPSDAPSLVPSAGVSRPPSDAPSLVPSSVPTGGSAPPSDMPSLLPSSVPTLSGNDASVYVAPSPTASQIPSDAPSLVPSSVPSNANRLY